LAGNGGTIDGDGGMIAGNGGVAAITIEYHNSSGCVCRRRSGLHPFPEHLAIL
jgi:hypothetical protein